MGGSEKTAAQRSRPRDRKQQIEKAAAEAFARSGYHAVSMQDIADTVGITATALYRHFPNKYALFSHTALSFADRLLAVTEEAASKEYSSQHEARLVLEELIDAISGEFVANRSINGVYRWESRYLEGDDRALLNNRLAVFGSRLQRVHTAYRPGLPDQERLLLLIATFSVISSVTLHNTRIAKARLRSLLNTLAWRLLDIDVETYRGRTVSNFTRPLREVDTPQGRPGSPRREHLVDAGIKLFAERGYNDVRIEDLAAEVGLTPSGVYRHFEGKTALLASAYDRAAEWLEDAAVAAEAGTAEEQLRLLCNYYVEHSFRSANLMRVYFSEQGNLTPTEQKRFLQMERDHATRWSSLLQEVHPDLNSRDATVPLYAFFSIIGEQLALLPEYDGYATARSLAFADALLGLGAAPGPGPVSSPSPES